MALNLVWLVSFKEEERKIHRKWRAPWRHRHVSGGCLVFLVYFFKFIFGCIGSSLLRVGATLCCGARASHCGGFSCCRARALGAWASVVVAHGLSSCGSRALERRLSSCGAQA